MFRAGLASFINDEPDLVTCCEASSAPLALHLMRTCPFGPCEIAVLDISLPGPNGIELIKLLKAEHPKLKILMLSMHEESIYAIRALRAGALGYVMKGEELEVFVRRCTKLHEERSTLAQSSASRSFSPSCFWR